MNATQKEQVQFGVTWAVQHIQAIERESSDLKEKLSQIDFELLMMLDDVIEALPQALRKQAQSCLDTRKRVYKARWAEADTLIADMEKSLAAWRGQKETSPECLAASDSF